MAFDIGHLKSFFWANKNWMDVCKQSNHIDLWHKIFKIKSWNLSSIACKILNTDSQYISDINLTIKHNKSLLKFLLIWRSRKRQWGKKSFFLVSKVVIQIESIEEAEWRFLNKLFIVVGILFHTMTTINSVLLYNHWFI